MKNFKNPTGNPTHELSTCSAVPQSTALPRSPVIYQYFPKSALMLSFPSYSVIQTAAFKIIFPSKLCMTCVTFGFGYLSIVSSIPALHNLYLYFE